MVAATDVRAMDQRRPRVTSALFGLVAVLHALAVITQPVLAGRYLSGDFAALGLHGAVGLAVVFLGFLLLLAAVLLWRPGHGPGWVVPVAALVLVAEIVQLIAGYGRLLAVHIPLGVAIVGGGVALTVRAFLPWRRP